jgi:HEAT repeat protein
VLVEEFRCASAAQVLLKWAIGNALSVVADEAVFDDVAELVRDQRHGKAREMLAVALGNMSTPAAVAVLTELLQDDEVAGHAIIGLGNLRATAARGAIEGFLRHPKSWIRAEARKALKKIGTSGLR